MICHRLERLNRYAYKYWEIDMAHYDDGGEYTCVTYYANTFTSHEYVQISIQQMTCVSIQMMST